jgi:hypothetical protein
MVIVPLAALALLGAVNIAKLQQPTGFDASSVGGTYSFHTSAPVRSNQLTAQPWALPSAARLSAARGSQLLLGVETQTGPFDLGNVANFQNAVQRDVDFVQYGRPWTLPFQKFLAQDIWRRGAIPILTWEPWTYAGGEGPGGASLQQPRYQLRRIITGKMDDYIRAYARAMRSFNHPILLRFAPEMNGNWNSWSTGVNGNRPGDYVRAWRHVHRIFVAAGATNVLWVWAPNVTYRDSKPLAGLYPGNAYVDLVGLDGYNWGLVNPGSRWQGFGDIFGPTLKTVATLAPGKPVLITETASTEIGGSKATWIAELFAGLRRHPEIIGVNWFNQVKETDWRVQSSPAAEQAFVTAEAHFPTSPAARIFRDRLWQIDRQLNKAQRPLGLLTAKGQTAR